MRNVAVDCLERVRGKVQQRHPGKEASDPSVAKQRRQAMRKEDSEKGLLPQRRKVSKLRFVFCKIQFPTIITNLLSGFYTYKILVYTYNKLTHI